MLAGKMILLVVMSAFGVFALVAMVFAFRSLFKVRSSQRYFEQAKKTLWEGRKVEALKLFMKAEKRWELNSYDGGRSSLMKDLEQYLDIAAGIFKIVGKQSNQVRSDIHGLVSEMKSHLKNRDNFGIDGRKMKPDAAVRWQAMCERLDALRGELRNSTSLVAFYQ